MSDYIVFFGSHDARLIVTVLMAVFGVFFFTLMGCAVHGSMKNRMSESEQEFWRKYGR